MKRGWTRGMRFRYRGLTKGATQIREMLRVDIHGCMSTLNSF
jgi:hypothetical protein